MLWEGFIYLFLINSEKRHRVGFMYLLFKDCMLCIPVVKESSLHQYSKVLLFILLIVFEQPFWPAVKCTKYVGRGVVGENL